MPLTQLPEELLDHIVVHTIPEGFEAFTLTCKKIFAICKRYIRDHRLRRRRYTKVKYGGSLTGQSFDLLVDIAHNPIVGRYVRDASLDTNYDARSVRPKNSINDLEDGPLHGLIARSPYLKEAGLDWQDYISEMKKELAAQLYSQYAATFCLTLLPNVEKLKLPSRWKSLATTDKLMDVVIRRANSPYSADDGSSLTKLTTCIKGPYFDSHPHTIDLNHMAPFLKLPQLRSFFGHCYNTIGNRRDIDSAKSPGNDFSHTITDIQLRCCNIDEVKTANFLQRAKGLKRFEYSFKAHPGDGSNCWNICAFITAISKAVGQNLQQLYLIAAGPGGHSLSPGKPSFQMFRQLEKILLPIEIIVCNRSDKDINSTTTKAGKASGIDDESNIDVHNLHNDDVFMDDGLPNSIRCLTFDSKVIPSSTTAESNSKRMKNEARAFDALFRHISKQKQQGALLALDAVQLLRPSKDFQQYEYEQHCARMSSEAQKLGITLKIIEWSLDRYRTDFVRDK